MMKTKSVADNILHSSDKHHVMLMYEKEEERSSAEIDCINQALRAGQYCVYATVDVNSKEFISNLATKIQNYKEHLELGNLLIVNFMPFYKSAAIGDLSLFKQLKAQVETNLKSRIALGKSGKTLLVADAACNLSRNVQFDECVTLERWWQDTYNEWMAQNLDITIICAHPSSVLKKEPHLRQLNRISQVHSMTLDLQSFLKDTRNPLDAAEQQTIRLLVVEPDADIRKIYNQYLQRLAIDVDLVESGRECLEKAIHPHNRNFYDIIIIDTHIKDSSGFHIARKILEERPDQYIIFTSTWDTDAVHSDLKTHSFDVSEYPVLQKPFRFSQLLALIKPAKMKNS
jgi:CheY-like chemotaxis protein